MFINRCLFVLEVLDWGLVNWVVLDVDLMEEVFKFVSYFVLGLIKVFG